MRKYLLHTSHCWVHSTAAFSEELKFFSAVKFQHTHANVLVSCPFRTVLPELSEQGLLLRTLQQKQDSAYKVKIL